MQSVRKEGKALLGISARSDPKRASGHFMTADDDDHDMGDEAESGDEASGGSCMESEQLLAAAEAENDHDYDSEAAEEHWTQQQRSQQQHHQAQPLAASSASPSAHAFSRYTGEGNSGSGAEQTQPRSGATKRVRAPADQHSLWSLADDEQPASKKTRVLLHAQQAPRRAPAQLSLHASDAHLGQHAPRGGSRATVAPQ